MKQTKSNKLSLGKKTISKLHELEMRQLNGGSSYPSYACVTNNCVSNLCTTTRSNSDLCTEPRSGVTTRVYL
jgi:hypothetical protein